MATPIPYTIKKGDSLSKIAGNLGIDDWHKLRTYHNNNCQPISEQIGEQLKEGKTLLTPSQDEIDLMNGKSREVIEEKKEEEKEIDAHEEDKEKEKQKEAEKGEHDNKYFVVHGAKCFCDQSEVPKKLADLQVTSHSKVVYNDEEGKYAATEEDKTFLPPAVTFGNCKLKPNGSGGYLPCSVAPAPKWDKPYDKTKILGKKVLTEISELKCTVGGKIAIEKHGQTDSVLTQHAENTNALELAMTNPALKIPPKKSEIPNVTHIVAKKIENHPDFKEKASNEEKGIEKIIARPHEEITFEAKVKTGNKKLVSWLVYEGHEGKKEQRLFMREQIGHEFKNSFEAGKYRVEGYGSPKEAGNDKNYASISLDIEVTNNKLSGSSLKPAAKDFTIDENGKHKLRKGFPAKFKAEFLIPPTAEELGKLKIYLTDESGNILDNGIQALNSFVFTPKNSTAKYNIVAEYIDTEGNLSVQTFSGETASNSVLGISHTDEIVRPLSNLQFSVTKTKFNVLVKSDADLTIPELSEIKWNLNGQLIGTGRTIAVPGILLAKPGDYVIEAFAISSNGFGRNAKKENDDWHFKVSENDVVSFTPNTIPKVGKWITLTADKFVFQNLLSNEKVNWHIEGGDKLADSMAIQFKPATAGIKNISCKINSQKGIRQSIEIKQAAINDVMFTDSNALKIEKASWDQKINIWIDQKELTGEKLEIRLRDSDTFNDDNVAPLISIPAYDGKLIPLTLDSNIKKKAGSHGELYVKINAPDLTATNESKKLGKVDVQDKTEIYNAHLGSEDGKEKHFLVDYDEISWFYAQSRGIKPEQKLYLEIRKVIKGIDPLLLYQDNVKSDESGVIRQKIVWNNINNKINFLTVYAMVRENDKNGKVLYDADGSFSMATSNLMKNSILMKVPNNKSAVMVEGSNVDKSGEKDCTKCKEKITTEQLKKIFTGVRDIKILEELTNTLNKYKDVYKLDTCARKAHFFAQALQESGSDLSGALHGESLDYSAEALPIQFRNFRKKDANGNVVDKFGKPTKINTNTVPNDLAYKYGRSAQNNYVANQKKIAEIAYDSRLGNKSAEDTWLFRGRGLLQITGRGTYKKIQTKIDEFASDSQINISNGQDNDYTPKEASITGMADWYKDSMYLKADFTGKKTDSEVVDLIVDIINRDTDSRSQRINNYKKTKVVFGVDKCQKIKPVQESIDDKNAIWRNPLDNPQITVYTFGGNKRPWRSAFGRVRTDMTGSDNGKRPHHGLDLFAEIGTSVYACLPGKVVSISPGTGYGKGFVLKVDPLYLDAFKKQRRNYEPYYIKSKSKYDKTKYDIIGYGDFEEYEGINDSEEVFFMYAHLSEIKVTLNQEISIQDYKTKVLGKTGNTGATGTKAPHLHFEVRSSKNPSGYSERYNPAYYVNYKNEEQLSESERKIQDKTAGK